jgi:hypothetical protein
MTEPVLTLVDPDLDETDRQTDHRGAPPHRGSADGAQQEVSGRRGHGGFSP